MTRKPFKIVNDLDLSGNVLIDVSEIYRGDHDDPLSRDLIIRAGNDPTGAPYHDGGDLILRSGTTEDVALLPGELRAYIGNTAYGLLIAGTTEASITTDNQNINLIAGTHAVKITSEQETTSTTTGALQVAGGVYVGKDLRVSGGNIIADTETTFNLLNTHATVINAFQAATSVNIGSDTASSTIFFRTTKNATACDDAGVMTPGGLGILLNLCVGGNTNLGLTNSNTSTLRGNVYLRDSADAYRLYLSNSETGDVSLYRSGANELTIDSHIVFTESQLKGPVTVQLLEDTTDLQIAATTGTTTVRNNFHVTGTSEFTGVATFLNAIEADSGNITSNQATFDLLNEPTTINFGNAVVTLSIGKDVTTAQSFLVGHTSNSLAEFIINPSTQSTTTTSGAFQVKGGVGITKNLNVGETATITHVNATNSFLFPVGINPTQTADGSAYWNSSSNRLFIGNGTDRQELVDLDNTQALINKTYEGLTITTTTGTVTLANSKTVDISQDFDVNTGKVELAGHSGNTSKLTLPSNAVTINNIAANHVVYAYSANTLSGEEHLAVTRGGTNIGSYTAGDILYATGTTDLAKLAKGTGNQLLGMNAGATAPEYKSITGADGIVITHSANGVEVGTAQSVDPESDISFNNMTLAGDLAVNGGNFTSTSTTFNMLNATVTTLNMLGEAGATWNLGQNDALARTININASTNFGTATNPRTINQYGNFNFGGPTGFSIDYDAEENSLDFIKL